jgi:arylsulfatase A-like enzyme
MAAPARQPNIVFVLTDDQGYGDLACHGNPYIRTPHVDALHAQSVRLANYHVGPTCSPTRAGLLTGHFHNSTGVWHTIAGRSLLRRDERTLADHLAASGYATGLFGKWHLGDAYPYRPQDRGFQEVVTHGGGGVGNTQDYWGNNYDDDTYCANGAWRRFDGYCTDVWFRLGLDFVERQHAAGRPFFCYIATNAPHLPHIVPERYVSPYLDLAQSDSAAARFFNYPASDQMLKFYGMVSCIDENVGALRARLDRLGIAENTIFIFMTDNGSAGGVARDRDHFITHGFNAGMRGAKGTPYEGGHRVPFFLHWPAAGLTAGRDVATLTANVDVAPTLLDLCGVPHDSSTFHGRSLVPLLGLSASTHTPHSGPLPLGEGARRAGEGSAPPSWPPRALVTDSQRLLNPLKWRLSCVMRQELDGSDGAIAHEWRLVNGRALHDLVADPEQRTDLASARPDVVERLRADYEDWWRLVSPRTGEEIPIPVGQTGETVLLTSHDWRRDPDPNTVVGVEEYGDDARCVWNQAQVRQAPEVNGYWEVEVARAGRYRVELRRWPREADLPLGAGILGEPKPYDDTIAAVHGGYGGGRALAIRRAAVRVAYPAAPGSGDVSAEAEVAESDGAAAFDLDLPAGPAHLHTAFSGAEAGVGERGAYYVYVTPHGGVYPPGDTPRVVREAEEAGDE